MAKRRRGRLRLGNVAIWAVIAALVVALYGWWAPFRYRTAIVSAASREHLSPYLVAAVVRVESGFRPTVISRRGAVGLMQLMPSSAQWIARQVPYQGPIDLTNPRVNVMLGSWYLKYLVGRFHGNLTLALAAYNGGPETVDRWLQQGRMTQGETTWVHIPYPETRHFVARVRRYRTAYRIMYAWLTVKEHSSRGVVSMAKLMSEETKMKLGERLGVDDIVRQEGWGGVPARQCGNLVREAIRLAEEELSQS